MIGARGLTHNVKLLELHHLDECVDMLHLRGYTVVALWIIRHAVAQPIRRENAKSLGESSKNRNPGICAGRSRRPRAVNQQNRFSATGIVIACPRAVRIHELRFMAADRSGRRNALINGGGRCRDRQKDAKKRGRGPERSSASRREMNTTINYHFILPSVHIINY